MQTGRTRLRRALISAGILSAAGWIGVRSIGRMSKSLLLLADCIRTAPVTWGTHYLWLSEREALGIVREGHSRRAFRLDIRTGRQTPLPALNTAFAAGAPTGEQHLSPDGRRLLWVGKNGFRVVAAALDGPEEVERRQGGGVVWRRDSRGWARLVWRKEVPVIQLQTLDAPTMTERTVPGMREVILKSPGGQHLGTIGLMKTLGITGSDHLLAAAPNPVTRSGVCFYDLAYTANSAPSRYYTVRLPQGMFADGIALSPGGDRLAWKLCDSNDPVPALWRRLLPIWNVPQHPRIGLWISRLDGSGLREIGHVDAPLRDGWNEALRELSWTPDGKRLSFLYKNALWTVPAD